MASIDKLTFKQLALSLNHQNAGEEKVSYLSIAYAAKDAAGALTEEHIDGYFGPYTYKSWFNINGPVATPMDWTKRTEMKFPEGFRDVPVTISKGKKEFEFDGCRLYFDRLRLIGGMVLPDFHIHIIKHTDQDLIQIRKLEYSEVVLSLGEGVLIERKARKQRQLPFDADPNADKDDDGSEEGNTTPLNGAHVSGGASEPDTTHVYAQHGENQERWNGPRCDLPGGYVEVDPPSGSKSEAEQLAGDDPNDLKDFAAGAAKAVGARKKRGSNVIDGRSERVREEDRKQGRGEAH